MKKTVLSAVALAVAFGAGISAAQAETRIGVTIYKYDDNFMSLMRKEIQKDADQLKDVKLLMNDSQNAQSIQNDQVDVLLSKGVKALAINLKQNQTIFLLCFSIKIRAQKLSLLMITLTLLVLIQKNPVLSKVT